jgi:hypothetical protein
MSDVHQGVWGAHPELRSLSMRAFEKAVSTCLEEGVDFVVISGDFFDTSMPPIDVIKFAVEQLRRLQDAGVRVYAIAGSHDYSPTGKTMLGVMEAAGLLTNTHGKLVKDEKTGTLIFGVEGLKGGLDKHTFGNLHIDLSKENGFKICMLHVAITEYSIPMMESVPLTALPRGFDYYANGHVHVRLEKNEEIGKIVLPGPIFPCDFTELEKVGHGSFCIVDVDNGKPEVKFAHLKMCDVELVEVDGKEKHPKEIEEYFFNGISKLDLKGKILLLKAKGVLGAGKPGDVSWKRISDLAAERGALSVKKSIHLESPETEVASSDATSVDQIEEEVLKKNYKSQADAEKAKALMAALAIEKGEDETAALFEERVKVGVKKMAGVEGI